MPKTGCHATRSTAVKFLKQDEIKGLSENLKKDRVLTRERATFTCPTRRPLIASEAIVGFFGQITYHLLMFWNASVSNWRKWSSGANRFEYREHGLLLRWFPSSLGHPRDSWVRSAHTPHTGSASRQLEAVCTYRQHILHNMGCPRPSTCSSRRQSFLSVVRRTSHLARPQYTSW